MSGWYGLPAPAGAQPVGSEFQVNSYTTRFQGISGGHTIAADGSGNFVVAWIGEGAGDDWGVFARRFNSAGVPLGSQFRANSGTAGTQLAEAVARDPNGNFVVVWQTDTAGGIFGQRYEGSGKRRGTEFPVNVQTAAHIVDPSVAADQDGNFVVVWTSGAQPPGPSDVFGQRFDRAGRALGSEFVVNSYTTGRQLSPSVAASDASGNFVVVWSATRPRTPR